jgi:hypothetical protein
MTYEEWHAFIGAHLPEPVVEETTDIHETWFTSGDPGEVVVRLRHTTVTVFEYAVAWKGQSVVVRPRRVGSLRAAGVDDGRAMSVVQGLVAAAREARTRRFRSCRVCERRHPPESMHDDDLCHTCAEQSLDVVH